MTNIVPKFEIDPKHAYENVKKELLIDNYSKITAQYVMEMDIKTDNEQLSLNYIYCHMYHQYLIDIGYKTEEDDFTLEINNQTQEVKSNLYNFEKNNNCIII